MNQPPLREAFLGSGQMLPADADVDLMWERLALRVFAEVVFAEELAQDPLFKLLDERVYYGAPSGPKTTCVVCGKPFLRTGPMR